MLRGLSLLTIFLSLFVVKGHGACANPKVTSETYSTGDELMSSEVVFIVQMEVECEGETVSLHALVDDQLLPVARSLGANKYQLTWTEPYSSVKVGVHKVNFYNDEGATAIRKALRYGEETSAAPLFTVEVNHKALRSGSWLAPSFIAACISLLVWWLAYAAKGKLTE